MTLRAAAFAVAGLLAVLVLGTALAVALAGGAAGLAAGDWAAVRFSLTQAALSALFSTLLAVPVARAMARRRFPGRGALVTLTGAPFLLPVIVAVLGLLAIFGRAGLVNRGLEALGLPGMTIYGLHGVVIAHVFLNLPLVVRMLLIGWAAIPVERFRLAQSLDMGPGAVLRHLELPMLRAVLPGAALTVFVICLSSFAVTLMLGGGPRATSVELAIYQALRFDFDPPRAAALSAVQFALCSLAVLAAGLVARLTGFGGGMDRGEAIPAPGGWRRLVDGLVIGLAALLLALPISAVVAGGLPGWAIFGVGCATLLRSVAVALASAALAVAAGAGSSLGGGAGAAGMETVATLPLAASALVIGTGLFLMLRRWVAPETLALPVTVAVNATLALPFVFRLLLPEAKTLRTDWGRLMASLDMGGRAALRWVILPRLARPLGYGAGLAAALSMGDLGVIALFAYEGQETLPLLVQRLAGAYRMEAAAGAALVLVVASFTVFAVLERGGRLVRS
ncbi:MAG: thiamine/thiamine pyrophosphate ABC transporter permease ThiP [Exiguobacterium profundum]|nr:MAG: thiamine/thiamine pyrophosphate ABC transporter permease ThiP [Exiguobacterium profundum]